MKKLKRHIALVVTNDLSQDQRMHRIAKSLSDFGMSPILIGRKRNNSIAFNEQNFGHHRLKCTFQKGIMYYLEYNFRLFIFLFRLRPDSVCAVDLDTIIASRTYCCFTGSKFIFDAHEYFENTPELTARKLKKWIWKIVRKIFLLNSTNNITVNESLKEELESEYGLPFKSIQNFPLKTNNFKEPSKLRDPVKLLYQGMLNKGRGLELMIELIAQMPMFEFTIIGNGDIEDLLKKQVHKLRVWDRVIFKGFVNPRELKKMTLKFDIGINILDGLSASYYFSSANKAYDYIMAGLPAIHMNFPEYRKINKLHPCSILIDHLDLQNVKNAIQKLVSDQNYYLELSKNCTILRHQLCWENESYKLLQIFK